MDVKGEFSKLGRRPRLRQLFAVSVGDCRAMKGADGYGGETVKGDERSDMLEEQRPRFGHIVVCNPMRLGDLETAEGRRSTMTHDRLSESRQHRRLVLDTTTQADMSHLPPAARHEYVCRVEEGASFELQAFKRRKARLCVMGMCCLHT